MVTNVTIFIFLEHKINNNTFLWEIEILWQFICDIFRLVNEAIKVLNMPPMF